MSTELRELFDTAAESTPPHDLGERAMAGARRRRQRQAVVGAVVASAAMVLGVVVVSGQLQTDASPRPIDVANLPDALPAADGLPNLEPGMVDAASVAYLDGSFMVVVDASTGEAARQTFGPPPVDGAVFSIAITPTDVVLSPDGRRALVTVTGWQGALPTLRVVDLATTQETVVPDLTPSNPSIASQIERPAVVAWSNDSSSVTCVCTESEGSRLGLYEVLLRDRDPLAAEARQLWAIQPEVGSYQVAIGTAGLAVQRKPGGPWPLTFLSEGGPAIPAAETVALGRGTARTYFALSGDGFTIGEVGRNFSDPVTLSAEGSLKYERHLGDVVEIPTVEAVGDGFAVVVTTNSLARNLRSAPPVDPAQVLLVGTGGEQGLVTTLPSGVVVASFATDRLQVPPPPTPQPDLVTKVPDALPAPDGLPTLTVGTMDAASAAYLVDGEVVVIDAATGSGAVIDALLDPAGYPLTGSSPSLGVEAEIALSPNGRYLWVSTGPISDGDGAGQEWMWLIDVATADVGLQESLELASAAQNSTARPSRMTWSPDGSTFACICTFLGRSRPELFMVDMTAVSDDLVIDKSKGTGVTPTQISWGTDGLVARLPELGGDWRLAPPGDGSTADPKEWPTITSVLDPGVIDDLVTAVVMGQSRQGGFLGVMKGGREFWIANDVRDWMVPTVSVRPMLGALGSSYFTVDTDWKGDPVNDEVVRIDSNGETPFTTLPPGATTVSFASDLID